MSCSESEEEFFSSIKKKRKISTRSTTNAISSDEEDSMEPQTPKISCAPRSSHTRSSERLRNKKQFVMPKKEDVFRDIPSSEKVKARTPSKCVNDFTRVTNRYNADRYETFEDDNYDSDDIDDFINDEEESDEDSEDEKPHPSRIKGYRRRLVPKASDSESEESGSCQPLDSETDTEDKPVKNTAKADNTSRSNSPVSGVKLKKSKYKSNVIESSDSDTELEENSEITAVEERVNDQSSAENSNNSEALHCVTHLEDRESSVANNVQTDSGTEIIITESDEELYLCCASVDDKQTGIIISDKSSENESSSGCESETDSSSESETEEEVCKEDRAYRQRKQKLQKFEEFKEQRRKRKLSK
ncbi:transcriptional regulator ATRX homolog [Saccostrea echinata]|uniref:transcriptional regulator ATRX homolog n=1 Tax=Saccostrea echinata TaxID=191078 RepID=UPI002A7EC4A8|nr:transcriptional regulator ATRX homolog [Saccostrea echinata]